MFKHRSKVAGPIFHHRAQIVNPLPLVRRRIDFLQLPQVTSVKPIERAIIDGLNQFGFVYVNFVAVPELTNSFINNE